LLSSCASVGAENVSSLKLVHAFQPLPIMKELSVVAWHATFAVRRLQEMGFVVDNPVFGKNSRCTVVFVFSIYLAYWAL